MRVPRRVQARPAGRRRAAWLALFASVLAAAALAGYAPAAHAQAAAASPCQAVEGPAYLGSPDSNKTSVIVFVHGVLSSAAKAWSADDTHSWPCLLRTEPAFDNSNIYLYGYATSLTDPSPSTETVAARMLADLEAKGVLKHAHITIVAHSMGGLVTARMLLAMQARSDMQTVLHRIKLVGFFGTPATGSDIANIASLFSDSPQFDEMKRNSHQQDLIARWTSVPWPFAWYCLAEGKQTKWGWASWVPLTGTMVVAKDSAHAFCRGWPTHMQTLEPFDHVTLVKPAALVSDQHQSLMRLFMQCASGALPRTYPDSEASKPDGSLMLQTLSQLREKLSDLSTAPAAVEEALYVKDAWANKYFMPSNPPWPPGPSSRNRPARRFRWISSNCSSPTAMNWRPPGWAASATWSATCPTACSWSCGGTGHPPASCRRTISCCHCRSATTASGSSSSAPSRTSAARARGACAA